MNPPFNGRAYFKNRDFTGEDWAKGGVNELPDLNGAVGKDYEHFRKGFHDVTPGGTISSVMSRSWFTKPTKDVKSFRRWLGIKDDGFLRDFAENPKADDVLRWQFSYKGFTHSACLRCIPADWFKESGTTFPTCILTVYKAGIYKDRNKGTDSVLLENFEFDY
ncbi:MAG: hypothetical protein AAFO96_03570 [Bacteroidota bacterium]